MSSSSSPMDTDGGAGDGTGDGKGGPTGSFPQPVGSLELLRRYQAGDESALDTLLRAYRGRLLRIVRIRMGFDLKRHEDAEDLVQETLIIASRKLRDLDPVDDSSILRWLVGVAKNQIRGRWSHYRAAKRSPPGGGALRLRGAGGGSSSGVDVEHAGPSPSDIAHRKEAQETLDAAVAALEPEVYRKVILERDYLGADWETVRQRLDRPSVQATQELHRRAHIKLRKAFRSAE